MINPNKSITQRALAGVEFLRMHAQAMDDADNFWITLMREPHIIAADAIEQLVKENAELRAQLIAFQKAANPVVAFDPAKEGAEHTAYTTSYTPFTKGARVCLKASPNQRGTVGDTCTDNKHSYLAFVHFESDFEPDRWVKVRHLALIPGK
ncbi:TPA: hypothetical protein G8O67_004897 [Salmonella enterica]|uniref:Uncharacterized protein n=1 Tax=Salmonella enterica TaxID=28901 RepID=A0A756L9X0_SALER|nr:hypothetical protein [Salmonella enterica]